MLRDEQSPGVDLGSVYPQMPEVFEFAELRIMYDHAMKLHPEVANFALQKLTQESMERAKTFYKSMLLQSGVGADSLALQKAKLHAHILLYLQGDKYGHG